MHMDPHALCIMHAMPMHTSSSTGAARRGYRMVMCGECTVMDGECVQPSARAARARSAPRSQGTPCRPAAFMVGADAPALSVPQLRRLLVAAGEFPARQRVAIWEFVLQLPGNSQAWQGLRGCGEHPCVASLADQCAPFAAHSSRAPAQRAIACAAPPCMRSERSSTPRRAQPPVATILEPCPTLDARGMHASAQRTALLALGHAWHAHQWPRHDCDCTHQVLLAVTL
jgi:hypothetical protein